MVSRIQIVIMFFILTVMVFLGDEKQSITLVVGAGGVLSLYLYDWYTQKTTYTIDKTTLLAWSVFAAVFIAASVGSISLGYSITEATRYLLAFLLYVYFSNKSSPKLIEQLSMATYIWAITLSFLSFVFVLFPILQTIVPRMNLIYKAYGHNHIVDIIFFTLPYSLLLLKQKKGLLSGAGFITLLITFIFSSSRGGMLLLLLYSAYFLIFHIKRFSRYIKIFIVVLVFGSIGVLLWIYPAPTSQHNAFGPTKTSVLESRVQYWGQALRAIKVRPVLGWGPGTFYLLSKRFQERSNAYSWYAHSFPLQVFSEMGVVGLLVFLWLVWCALRTTIRGQLYHGVILSTLYGAVEMNLDFIVVWVLFWVTLALLHPKATKHKINLSQKVVSISILLLGIFYASNIIGNLSLTKRTTGKLSFYMQPYDTIDTINFLEKTPQGNLSQTDVSVIRAFHAQDPEVLFALSKHMKQKSDQKSTLNLVQIYDPKNMKNVTEFIRWATEKKEPQEILYKIGEIAEKQKDIGDIKAVKDILIDKQTIIQSDTGNIYAFIGDAAEEQIILAKSLYYIGYLLLPVDTGATRILWGASKSTAPDWGHFQVEYASLLDVLGEKALVEKVLADCRKRTFPKKQCEGAAMNGMSNPGGQYQVIKKIPSVGYEDK